MDTVPNVVGVGGWKESIHHLVPKRNSGFNGKVRVFPRRLAVPLLLVTFTEKYQKVGTRQASR